MCFGMLLYFGGKYNRQNASDLSRLALRRLMEWLPPDLPLVRNLFGAGSQPKLCYMPDADEKPVEKDHEISEPATNLLPSIMPYLLILCVLCFGLLTYFGGNYWEKVRDSLCYIQRVLPRIPFVGSLFGGKYKQKLLFVPDASPDADNEQKVGHAISDPALFRFLLNEENSKRQIDEAEAGIPKMLDVLKDVDKNWEIKEFETHQSSMGSAKTWFNAFHVFIVFKTTSETVGVYWWSLEKGLDYITLQRSRNKENVINNLKGKQRNKVKPIKEDLKGKGTIKDLFGILWAQQLIPENYHIKKSNCQSLVSFVGQQITEIGYNYEGYFKYFPPPEKGLDKKMLELINVITICSDWSPLFHLIKMGSTDLVAKTVASGKYDINASCNGLTPLHLAIRLKKTKMVKHLLQPPLNADPAKRDKKGMNALLFAVSKIPYEIMKEEIIDLLLAHDKVNVDDVDEDGQTALHLAARDVNIFQKLLERGANPNVFDKWGQSPLHLTVQEGDGNKIINLLLAHDKVMIDHADEDGKTALHLAAYRSNVVAVRKLIEKGANPNIIDKEGQSPLHLAANRERNGNVIMDLLLAHSKVKVDDVDGKGQTALHFAAYKSNDNVVKYLIDKGANPNIYDKSGRSPLHVAAQERKGNPIIDLILEAQKVKGIGDVNDQIKQGRTALHFAAAYSNEITAEHLINKGANVNCRTNAGLTPLHYAALGAEDMDIIDLLLQNINERDIEQYRNDERLFLFARHNLKGLGDAILDRLVETGITPPCGTETDDCTGESDEAITGVNTHRFVLDKGADPSIDLTGFDGLDFLIARVKISLGIYDNINGRDPNGETPLLVAIRANYVNVVRNLLENGADPTVRDEYGYTPFHVAVMYDTDCNILNLLLESGKVDINETTKYGMTALHMAIKQSNKATVEFLLTKGANPNVTDQYGNTPLHLAAQYAKDMDIVELLVNHKDVDVNCFDNKGYSALDQAKRNDHGHGERIANLLKEKGAVERELPKGNNDSLEKLEYYTSSDAADEIESVLSDAKVPIEDQIARIQKENLISATRYSDVERVRRLLKNGTDISRARGEDGMNALHVASCCAETTDLIDVIYETGEFDINGVDNSGNTPLYWAIRGTNRETNARHLIRKGADPTIADKYGNTLLHLVSSFCFAKEKIETINVFLENETVDINSRNKNGQTALHHAIRFSKPITVRYLLKKGADPNAADENGATSLHLAAKKYSYKNTELIDIILETGKCNINGVDNYGRTPLHYAIEGYFPGAINVRRLIEMGADPGIADKNGVTPLHMAAIYAESMDLIHELLLEVKTGAVDVNCVDIKGRTPLACARNNKYGLSQSIIARLKEYGAKE